MAWGVVPTSDLDAIHAETAESLAGRWTSQIVELAAGEMAYEQILAQSLFTPSCGCGSLPEDYAAKVLDLLKGFCRIIREQRVTGDCHPSPVTLHGTGGAGWQRKQLIWVPSFNFSLLDAIWGPVRKVRAVRSRE